MPFYTSILLTWLDGFWTYCRNAVADEFLLAVRLPQSSPGSKCFVNLPKQITVFLESYAEVSRFSL
jgi:hypothetical protein